MPIANDESDEIRSGVRDGASEIEMNWYGIGDSIILSFLILNFKELEAEFNMKKIESLSVEKGGDKGISSKYFF